MSAARALDTPARAVDGHDQHGAVAALQRARILAAVVEVCGEQGAGRVTVADVVSRAGVSRRTFYEFYASCQDCLLAALERALEQARAHVLAACEGNTRWLERMRGALTALLELFEAEARLARLLVVDSLSIGHAATALRGELLGELYAAVDTGRSEARNAAAIPTIAAEATVGGMLAVLYGRIVAEPRPALLELRGPLMSMLVLPYLGGAAARAELRRAVASRARRRQERSDGIENPLSGLNMRVTYRTMRVLHAIGERPGASNKAVGEAAGATDQGQASKLLARLAGLELIANQGGHPKGAPNAWVLTERGRAVCGLGQAASGVDGRGAVGTIAPTR